MKITSQSSTIGFWGEIPHSHSKRKLKVCSFRRIWTLQSKFLPKIAELLGHSWSFFFEILQQTIKSPEFLLIERAIEHGDALKPIDFSLCKKWFSQWQRSQWTSCQHIFRARIMSKRPFWDKKMDVNLDVDWVDISKSSQKADPFNISQQGSSFVNGIVHWSSSYA